MDEVMTIEEINERFNSEWVLVEDPVTNDRLEVLSGKVLYHSKDRDEFDRKARTFCGKRFAVLYTGEIPEGEEIVRPATHLPIEQAVASLKSEGAREVYLFGSVARGKIRPDSDVDMAVSGLPPKRFFRAMQKAARLFKCPFDLVDLDDDTPFTRYLKRSGELVRVG